MNRKEFLNLLGLGATVMSSASLQSLASSLNLGEKTAKMPVFFIGHGSPMNAIEDNEFSRKWRTLAATFPKPKAILCISAHWETKGTLVTAMQTPQTIYDFGGFPQALFDAKYPAMGSPELANETISAVKKTNVEKDYEWGLDHGTWSVLLPMYPKADIPVIQLSLDYTISAQKHYEIGQELAKLRERGVLIIGSGNIVHNLRYANLRNGAKPLDWAIEFDELSKKLIDERSHDKLINFRNLGKAADLSIPTPEHYLPLLYILGAGSKKEELSYPIEGLAFGSGSMRSVRIG